MIDRRDFDFCAAHAVGNDVGRFRYDEFTRAGDETGSAEFRIFRQQVFDTVEDVKGDAFGRGGILLGDVRAQGEKVLNIPETTGASYTPRRSALLRGLPGRDPRADALVCDALAAVKRGECFGNAAAICHSLVSR